MMLAPRRVCTFPRRAMPGALAPPRGGEGCPKSLMEARWKRGQKSDGSKPQPRRVFDYYFGRNCSHFYHFRWRNLGAGQRRQRGRSSYHRPLRAQPLVVAHARPASSLIQLDMREVGRMPSISAYKLEYSFDHRVAECAAMLNERRNQRAADADEIWVPVVLEPAAGESAGADVLRRSRFLVPGNVSYSKFVRVLRERLEYPSGKPLYVLTGSPTFFPSPEVAMHKIFATEKDEDGFLYCTYTNDRPASLPPRRRLDMPAMPHGTQSVSDVLEGRKVRERGDKESGAEMTPICTNKLERSARRRHNRKHAKRAAGPREQAPSNLRTSVQLANALSNLQLDTCLKGMLDVATKRSSSPSQPSPYAGVGGSPNGAPCPIRVHNVHVH